VDTAKYAIGLRTARNCLIHPFGGVSNRPGTTFLGPVKDHDAVTRLIPFKFKTTDTYALEFGNLYMRVMRNDAHVTETALTGCTATAANPVVVTKTSHGFANGDEVFLENFVEMTQVNGKRFIVANQTANTFELTDQITGANIDGSAYTAETTGGDCARIYEIVTPYVTADLFAIKFTQSADVMTLVHKNYEPRELTRTDHAAWTLTAITFAPDQDHPVGQTVTQNGTPGSTTYSYKVTALNIDTGEESISALNNASSTPESATAADPVVVTDTGHPFGDGDEIEINGFVEMTEVNGRRFTVANSTANTYELAFEDGTNFTAESTGGTANQTFVTITNGNATLSATDNISLAWTSATDAGRYAIYKESNGLYGLIGETQDTAFIDNGIAPDLDTSPPRARNPFLFANNYPHAVGYYEQRRFFGGSTNNPDTWNASQTGNQSNMNTSEPGQDDDAMTVTLSAREVNEIRHFIPINDLIVMSSGSEWRVNSGQDTGFSATTLKQKPQTYWGTSEVAPLIVGNTVIFVQERGSVVRTLGYSLNVDGYTGPDASILARHLFEGKSIADWSFTQVPDNLIHAVMSDGTMNVLTYNQEQEVIAWTHYDTGGDYETSISLPDTTFNEDAAYFIVKRTINGNTVRFIERTHTRQFSDVRDAYFVDCGLSLDTPVTITGVTAADPVVVTATAHGFSNGDEVDIFDIVWVPDFDSFRNETQPDQLNTQRFTVSNKTANTFELQQNSVDIDGSAFNAYVSGGTVRLAVDTISGLDHLEGEPVAVLFDGNVTTSLTVASGAITLPRKASRVHIGLRYESDVELLDPEAPNGTIQGRLKKISHVILRFEKSRGLLIGPNSGDLTEVKQRKFEAMGDPTALVTDDLRQILPPEWNSNGRIFMRQIYPLPLTLLAAVPDIEIED
jgi:hypothetical protein